MVSLLKKKKKSDTLTFTVSLKRRKSVGKNKHSKTAKIITDFYELFKQLLAWSVINFD